MHTDVDVPTGKAELLQTLIRQIREIPVSRRVAEYVRGFGLSDAATLAGRLLLEANDLGVFDADPELKHLILAAFNGELEYQRAQEAGAPDGCTCPPLPWHVWVAAVRLLWRRQGSPYQGEGFGKRELLEGCPAVADYLEQAVMKLHEPTRASGTYESDLKGMQQLTEVLREQALRGIADTLTPLGDGCWTWDESDPHVHDRCNAAAVAYSELQSAMSSTNPAGEVLAPAAKKRRVKREVANNMIMQHLVRRPHDTVEDVTAAVGCSTGLVCESPAWRANQVRLADAKVRNCDPIALSLRDYLAAAGDSAHRQNRTHREAQAGIDSELDAKERELFRQIDEYRSNHPHASEQEVAKGVGCIAADVERRQAALDTLTAEQACSQAEDDFEAERQKRVRKQV